MTDASKTVAVRPGRSRPGKGAAPSTYASWDQADRFAYARDLAGAADLIPRGLWAPPPGGGPPIPSPAKIFLVLETGTMLGLHPMAALQGIDVIEGQATVTPRLFSGLVRQAGHKLRTREEGSVETGDYKVTVTLVRHDDPDFPIEASFTPHMALRAGLVDKYERDDRTGLWVLRARSRNDAVKPWEAWTEDMCLWRAMGRIARRGAADVLMGIGYFPEELDATVDDTGARVQVDTAAEDDLIARIKELDDKADMADVWLVNHYEDGEPVEAWTDRVEAEFSAHLMRCKKDSRPPKDGRPGNTGDATVDGKAGTASEANAAAPQDADPGDHDRTPAEAPADGSGAQNAADVVDAEVVDDEGDEFTLEVPEGDVGAYNPAAADDWEAEAIRRHEAGEE